MRTRIAYSFQARHLEISQGHLQGIRADKDSRVCSVTYEGRTVAVEGARGTSVFTLPCAAVHEPDPGELDIETGILASDCVPLATDAVARYPVKADLSLYQEERTVEAAGSLKRQRMGFYVLSLQEQSRHYLYADRTLETLSQLCAVHSLPVCAGIPHGVPVLLSPNAVGHIFHEWVHLLELDFLGYAAASEVSGRSAFCCSSDLQVFEDPIADTVGFNAFSDECRVARRMPIVDRGVVAGFIDSSAFPCHYRGCGYLGYGNAAYPLPRTTNLMIQAPLSAIECERALVITGLDLELLTANPLDSRISLRGGEGIYVEAGMPIHRLAWTGGGKTTIQKLVSQMTFLDPSWLRVPVVGGLCVKSQIQVRSAQTAPAALLDDYTAVIPC